MKKREYAAPELEISRFEQEDIISASSESTEVEGGNVGEGGNLGNLNNLTLGDLTNFNS